MEHRLGQPLVGKVFQQGIDKRQGGVGGQHLAPRVLGLKAAYQRCGVGDGLQRAIGARQVKGGQQVRFGHRQARHPRARWHQPVGDAAVAQQRHHLARVGRARNTAEQQGGLGHPSVPGLLGQQGE